MHDDDYGCGDVVYLSVLLITYNLLDIVLLSLIIHHNARRLVGQCAAHCYPTASLRCAAWHSERCRELIVDPSHRHNPLAALNIRVNYVHCIVSDFHFHLVIYLLERKIVNKYFALSDFQLISQYSFVALLFSTMLFFTSFFPVFFEQSLNSDSD